MAGSYPDYASWRMPYDRDGTTVFKIDTSNVVTALTTANIGFLANENSDAYAPAGANLGGNICFIFPELRDLDGYTYINDLLLAPVVVQVSTSVNTTNGVDGTWVNLGSSFTPTIGRATSPFYRTDYTAAAVAGIKAIKFNFAATSGKQASVSAIHLFGKITAGQNPNRLILWHPTLDQRVPANYFDWGDVARNSATTDRTFRVKNNSSTLTANSITTSLDVLSDGSPTLLAGQHSLSFGGAFAQTQALGNLAPGAISGTVTLRRTIASNAQLSVWALRVIASATSWT